MFVDNCADAEGVLIMAEMPGNHIDNGVIVRVINSNNNSLVSMIFPAGSAFPSSVAITIAEDGLAGNGYEGGMEIVGDFTFYNYQTGKFSLTLSSEKEITMPLLGYLIAVSAKINMKQFFADRENCFLCQN